MKLLLACLCFLCTAFAFGQQNEEFQQVKEQFDFERQNLTKQFKKLIQQNTNPVHQTIIQGQFEEYMAKIDSVQNDALVHALVKVKNDEDLKKLFNKNSEIIEEASGNHQPQYPGGINQLRNSIAQIFYFDGVVTSEKTLKTQVTFQVEKDGQITNVKAVSSHPIFNRQAEIAVYMLPEKFYPSPAILQFSMPLTMTFEQE